MTIEFADPGMDPTGFWILILVAAFGVFLFGLGMWIEAEGLWIFGIACFTAGLVLSAVTPLMSYDFRIRDEAVAALERSGFESVSLSRDRFTADMNGRFYRGVLVDLAPESGYAYRVLEMTDTKETP